MAKLRVLISGASIAGPTAAYWFARAGAAVTVVERYDQFRTSGNNVDIRTAGVTVMRKIPGMEEAVRAKNIQMSGICFLHSNGTPVATLHSTGDTDAQSLVSEFEIFRGDLAKILYDLTAKHDNIRYVFGEQIAAIDQSDAGDAPAKVTFANGKLPTAEYDLVVAADGVTSRTRAIGLQCGARDHVRALNCYAAYFSTAQDFLVNGRHLGHAYSEPPGRFVAAGPDPFTGRNRITLMGLAPYSESRNVEEYRRANAQGEAAVKQYISEKFSGMGWQTSAILQDMHSADDFYSSEWCQVKLPSLSRGRFVLIGDAGAAPGPTGNGTSLAMASAYILAGEMAKADGNVLQGLQAFEQRMKPIIADMQSIPPGVTAFMAPQSAWGTTARNTFMKVASVGTRYAKYFAWIGKYFASSFGGDKYNIPDYQWPT